MNKEAIILAGGLGSRLRSVVNDRPKVLAPVNGKPFLLYILTSLKKQGVGRILVSAGYMHQDIENFISKHFPDLNVSVVVEQEPLGTGGGMMNALKLCSSRDVLVVNGDTYFNIDLNRFYQLHNEHHSDFSIALKRLSNFDRYGTVQINADNKVTAFSEKRFVEEGFINGGIYLINRAGMIGKQLPAAFSLEKDFMEKEFEHVKMHAFAFEDYFIDIGIPEDYAKAERDFKQIFNET